MVYLVVSLYFRPTWILSDWTGSFNNNRILLRDRIARMRAEGKLSQDVDPETASSTIIAMTMGLRMSTFCLGRDTEGAKKMWMDSVERILGIGPERKGE